jgi:hypothetical protein
MIVETFIPTKIPVSRPQQKIIRPTLGWIMKHEKTDKWSNALRICCLEADPYLGSSKTPQIVIPTEGPTQLFRFLRHDDPRDEMNEAIDFVHDEIGLNDLGAAITFIAAVYVLTKAEIATSPSRKMRALRTRLEAIDREAKAKQGSGKP